MRLFSLIVAGLALLILLYPARSTFYRRFLCKKMNGRCEIECLTFEKKIGTCQAKGTPLCCRERKKH
ncbi:beta-defensin 13-like [Apodemus sylvaticus]|uniref:beta-defensin 13-like n=1 Tax=Apodemus sylvaticus TaxID=10129 RepID=UPI00224420AB|nr:beta-defensin 13-like [Apodemus sylvaticus]